MLRIAFSVGAVPGSQGSRAHAGRARATRTVGWERQMRKPLGLIRLHALPAPDVWHAPTALTLYAVEPRSTVSVALSVTALRPGDIAGLALFNTPYAWLGVERVSDGLILAQVDRGSGRTSRSPLRRERVWLRADCDFASRQVGFRYSADGRAYAAIAEPCPMGADPLARQAIRCSLFSCTTTMQREGGHADFDSFVLTTERLHHRDEGR